MHFRQIEALVHLHGLQPLQHSTHFVVARDIGIAAEIAVGQRPEYREYFSNRPPDRRHDRCGNPDPHAQRNRENRQSPQQVIVIDRIALVSQLLRCLCLRPGQHFDAPDRFQIGGVNLLQQDPVGFCIIAGQQGLLGRQQTILDIIQACCGIAVCQLSLHRRSNVFSKQLPLAGNFRNIAIQLP